MSSSTKRTPKQRVLKKWPHAFATKGYGFYAGMWVIRGILLPNNVYSNHARTAAGAWRAAAKDLS